MNDPKTPPVPRIDFIGKPVTRLEDLPLVTGRGRFVADVMFPHQLHMRVVRSDHAHGRIVSVDAAAARALPGVEAVWTIDDIPDLPFIDFRATSVKGLEPYRQPVLARNVVRYVGEPIAVVFAEDAYLAEDAAELVTFEIESLPVQMDAQDPPGEFEPGVDTEPTIIHKEYGDVDAVFETAHAVVELDLKIGRHSGVPMETRGAVARHDASRDVLELHGATKRPHFHRDQVANMLGRSPSSVQFYEGHIGGGFGIRGELYPEDILVCHAALRLGRPVKWIEDRREHLLAANHSREQRHKVRAAADADGNLLAIDNTFFHDQGAYIRTHGVRVPDMTAGMLPGPYRLPSYRAAGHVRLTNKTPAATYRAPGRFESTFVRERVMDAIAAKLGMDPVAVRRRNLIPKAEMPYARGVDAIDHEVILDSGDYALLLDKALARIGWDDVQAEVAQRRAAGETVGAGLGIFVEKSAPGPVDGVRVKVDASGTVEVITGGASIGQGFETVMAQICADALGVDYRNIRVLHGQTELIDYGFGAHASRATVMTGEATRAAATNLRAKALDMAADLLQAPAEVLDIVDGRAVRTDTGASIGLDEIARNMAPASKALGDREPGLTAQGWYRTDLMAYPYGVHAAVVRVDRETGGVDVEKFLIAYDIGRSVNPMLVEGQLVGGFAQGLGGALYEEFVYDENGQPLSVTFADYLIPTLREMPEIDTLVTEDAPSPLNPLGLKGAGEGGINAVGAAIAAAIDQAIGIPGAVTQLPVTPRRMKAILKREG